MVKIPPEFFISQDPPKFEHIVEIPGFKRVLQSIELGIDSERGKIVLLSGTRGIGKSTCLFFSKKYVEKDLTMTVAGL